MHAEPILQGMDPHVIAAQARDPHTPPARLANLAAMYPPLVAANPNAAAETLWTLAFDYPQIVLKNPVLPLLLLESPGAPPIFSAAALAMVEACPEHIALRVRGLSLWAFGLFLTACKRGVIVQDRGAAGRRTLYIQIERLIWNHPSGSMTVFDPGERWAAWISHWLTHQAEHEFAGLIAGYSRRGGAFRRGVTVAYQRINLLLTRIGGDA